MHSETQTEPAYTASGSTANVYYTDSGTDTADGPGWRLTVNYTKIYGLAWPLYGEVGSHSSAARPEQMKREIAVRDAWSSFVQVVV
eukprot:SAG31_NODE_7392_length_1701_cov_3.198502_4_plen_85_part_01